MVHKRDITIDTLRGLAILTMVAANMAAPLLAQPHPFWFRCYSSVAAPLFILISGMMVVLTTQTKGHGLGYFLVRGTMIIIVGALVDVFIWNIYPFMTVDVLCLIGISLPLAFLFLRWSTLFRWVIVILIFLVTPALQEILGYTDYPTESYLWGEQTVMVANQTSIFNHWVVDGWFPIFPWLGFSLLGVNLASLRWKYDLLATFGKKSTFLAGTIILALGSIIWWSYPGRLLVREGYSELFYPPTLGYVISAIGLIVLVFSMVDWGLFATVYKPLQVLGESALPMYVLHLCVIEYLVAPVWSEEDLPEFFLVYIVLSFFLTLMAYGLRLLKTKWKDRPFVIRFLLGS